MGDLCRLIWCAVIGLFRSRAALQAEILVLRHQLMRPPKRVAFSNVDRLVFIGLYRLAPAVLDALKILKPETLIRWHRTGFRAYRRWKSRPRGGRPCTAAEFRQLIREMSVANPLWGAPRTEKEQPEELSQKARGAAHENLRPAGEQRFAAEQRGEKRGSRRKQQHA